MQRRLAVVKQPLERETARPPLLRLELGDEDEVFLWGGGWEMGLEKSKQETGREGMGEKRGKEDRAVRNLSESQIIVETWFGFVLRFSVSVLGFADFGCG